MSQRELDHQQPPAIHAVLYEQEQQYDFHVSEAKRANEGEDNCNEGCL